MRSVLLVIGLAELVSCSAIAPFSSDRRGDAAPEGGAVDLSASGDLFRPTDATGDRGGRDGKGELSDGRRLTDGARSDGSRAGCSQTYGAIDGYVGCKETATTCAFYYRAKSGKHSCAALCPKGCLEAYDVGTTDRCESKPRIACGEQHTDALCVCVR